MSQTSQSRATVEGTEPAVFRGRWTFDPVGARPGDTVTDRTGNGFDLSPTASPKRIADKTFGQAIALDGATQWLGTSKPVLRTDQNFSVAAWVRLDAAGTNGRALLEPGEHAMTAISQDSPSHSAFYLGIRQFPEKQADGTEKAVPRWNFTVAPVDGSLTGELPWTHAAASPVDEGTLGQWVLLVGACDVSKGTAHLYIPSIDAVGVGEMPNGWTFWQADGGFQVGRARWLGRDVDQWSGSIGPVSAYSGLLTAADAKQLYAS
jgi:hypothetical protein